jgi:O-acetyl-ADP-ribose deacetylase (regulator of RNase III)
VMGAGYFGVPLATAAEIMFRALKQHLAAGSSFIEIVLCANDAREYRALRGRMALLD